MTNCRPGDLAIVVGCVDGRFNGATCEVVSKPQSDLPADDLFPSQYWLVRFARPMAWMARTKSGLECSLGREGNFPDMWLRRIGGPDVAERVLRDRLSDVMREVVES